MRRRIKYSKRAIEVLEALGISYSYVRHGLAFDLSKSDYKILLEIISEDIEKDG